MKGKKRDLKKLKSVLKSREAKNDKERKQVYREWAVVKAKFDARRKAYRSGR